MNATTVRIIFWEYELTKVSLPTDIHVHYNTPTTDTLHFQPTGSKQDGIDHARKLAELLGARFEIVERVLPLTAEEKALIESGAAS